MTTAPAMNNETARRMPATGELPLEKPQQAIAPNDLVSVLIPCCGQLEYTKLCVASLLRQTRKPFEVIFLDIGSLDGTREFLAGIASASSARVEAVRAATDEGIGAAIDEALKQAHGEFLVLLNNDTIVTEGWLQHLVSLAQLTPAIGVVGPMSNYAPPEQQVEKVPYRIGPRKRDRSDWLIDTDAVDDFARQWREQHRGSWKAVERLGGFCLLIKREVLRRIGPLREAPDDLGLFDTERLCTSARQAGFTLACCGDLFIHHFGTRTFAHGAGTEKK